MSGEQGLLGIRRFIIPRDVLGTTIAFLRDAGRKGNEAFVLWFGREEASADFRFTRAVLPAQEPQATPHGLLVTVPGDELFRINKAAYQQGETIGAQVHSHPTEAYHSETDDRYPLVTLVGALSLVIPNFAVRAPGDMDEWAWYRLSEDAQWDLMDEHTWIELE